MMPIKTISQVRRELAKWEEESENPRAVSSLDRAGLHKLAEEWLRGARDACDRDTAAAALQMLDVLSSN